MPILFWTKLRLERIQLIIFCKKQLFSAKDIVCNEKNIIIQIKRYINIKVFCKKSLVGGWVAEFIYAEGYSAEHTRQLISIADNDDTIQNISYDEEGNIDEIDIYKYTPYTCASNERTHSANVLFLEIYNGKMLSNFPLQLVIMIGDKNV